MPVVSSVVTNAEWRALEQEYNLEPKSFVELGREGHWLIDDASPQDRQAVVGLVPRSLGSSSCTASPGPTAAGRPPAGVGRPGPAAASRRAAAATCWSTPRSTPCGTSCVTSPGSASGATSASACPGSTGRRRPRPGRGSAAGTAPGSSAGAVSARSSPPSRTSWCGARSLPRSTRTAPSGRSASPARRRYADRADLRCGARPEAARRVVRARSSPPIETGPRPSPTICAASETSPPARRPRRSPASRPHSPVPRPVVSGPPHRSRSCGHALLVAAKVGRST